MDFRKLVLYPPLRFSVFLLRGTMVKIGEYIGFCVYYRSCLLWSPVINTCFVSKCTYTSVQVVFLSFCVRLRYVFVSFL